MDAAELARHLGRWRDRAEDLPTALADALAELIDAGVLPSGVGLPAQRATAQALRMSRGSVSAAYGRLQERGYVVTAPNAGSRVRSGRVRSMHVGEGRMFSFTSAPPDTIDLSSGALPASATSREALSSALDDLDPYLDTDGYFPAGLPVLRLAVADELSRCGVPTDPHQVLITSGAQQATYLAMNAHVAAGDTVVVDDPTYRGALEILRGLGAHLVAVAYRCAGADLTELRRALRRNPALFYCQTGVHNPTGAVMSAERRALLATAVHDAGVPVIEDCCSFDLTVSGRPAATLALHLDPDQVMSIGTTSKTFWGGVRVGWIRTSSQRITGLLEVRKAMDIATSIVDQLYALRFLRSVAGARSGRIVELRAQVARTEDLLRAHLPHWTWDPIAGGTCLWVDTGGDAVALAEAAKQEGILLAPGPAFSAHNAHRTRLRLPIWRDERTMRRAMEALAAVDPHRRG